MLLELRVENLLLIERAQLDLDPGLNVLTGETGAGKTVLAHALDLLLGGRSKAGIVRPGCSEAYVEGLFALPDRLRSECGELLPADAREIVVARRVGEDGRSRAYLNGRSATVADLRRLGEELIAFYGQHEHRKLTVASAQLEILDRYCGPAHLERREACAASHRECVRLEAELAALRGLAGARERELDLLEFELAEIEEAAPEDGEHERLREARERLRRLDALRGAAAGSAEALVSDAGDSVHGPSAWGGVTQVLAAAAGRLAAVEGVDPELDALSERFRTLGIEAEDLAASLRDYGDGLEAEDGSLEALEERLAMLERLMRKHGGSISSVLEHAERTRARREELLGAEIALERSTEAWQSARQELERHAQALRRARKAAAPKLARDVRVQLAALAMADATFEIELPEREIGATGGETVEMLIAPNPGVGIAPLREIASGGELSRVMLALASASHPVEGELDVASRAVMVFDEVDAGIGGHTARAVGERLRGLAAQGQVICITHLPQIASLADRHFSVVKDTTSELAQASVRRLQEREVVSELVRMLGAPEEDSAARRHARELRKAA